MGRKTDHSDLPAKLDLRRHFLRKYHSEPADVLDCYQGEKLIWTQLRQEFPVHTYWGVDLKKKKGRLKLDSVGILSLPGWPQNVVDVDTYGSPWKHWEALLPRLSRPTTVFLTIGQWRRGTDEPILRALGLGGLTIPAGIAIKLHGIALSYLLRTPCDYDIHTVEAVEAVSATPARYIGIRLEPGKKAARPMRRTSKRACRAKPG